MRAFLSEVPIGIYEICQGVISILTIHIYCIVNNFAIWQYS